MTLFNRGRIGALELKNRIIMAAMGIRGLVDEDGDWGERVRAFYEARARGGVGLITTEMAFVTRALEPVSKYLFDFSSDKHIASLSHLARTLHAYDCKLSVQLTAGFGRVVPVPVIEEGIPPVSASINTNYYFPDWEEYNTRALTTEEVASLARSFGYAAKRCREAGADCVELHAHEGYLLDQFMTSLWNRREDRYGGSLDNRLGLVREAIQSIQSEAGDDFPIIFRYGVTHYLEGGREEEEGLAIAKEMENLGVSALHVDAGCYETSWWPHPPSYQPPGCMVHLAEQVKRHCSIPVIAVGRLHYPEVAESVIAEGKADFVAIGRGLLAEPNWGNKVQEKRTDEITPCTGCHEGCLWQMIAGEPTSCAVNPLAGHETDRPITKLSKKKNLLIVGGGPSGIEAARMGLLRGFDVTLWEATDRLGGALWPASKPDFKRDLVDYRKYLAAMAKRLPIDVVFEQIANKDLVEQFGADYILLATGAQMEPVPFPQKGISSAIDILNQLEPERGQYLMLGGGVIGCETALHLATLGHQVTICAREDSDDLDMADFYDHNNRYMLLKLLKDSPNITIHRGAIPVEVTDDRVRFEQESGEMWISARHIVFAGRIFSNNGLVEAFADNSRVIGIGDCVEPGRIMDAVWGAFETVRTLDS